MLYKRSKSIKGKSRLLILGAVAAVLTFVYYSTHHRIKDTDFFMSKRVFINDAFLVSDSEIRVAFIGKCKPKNAVTNLYASIDGGSEMPLKVIAVDTCPSKYMPRCEYGGQYGILQGLNPSITLSMLQNKSKFEIFLYDTPKFKQQLILRDARKTINPAPFKLGVCPFPIMHMADWTILPQFFEMWIEHGARKFYFYIHSISKEFDAMLKIYERDPLITIERVGWAPFTVENTDKSNDDPNLNIFRGEETHAVNDCIYRARLDTKYLAIADFDETFITFGDIPLMSVMDEAMDNFPNIGGFKFRSHVAEFHNDYVHVKHPREINFNTYNNISLEYEPLPENIMAKMVVIPERVAVESVHGVEKYTDPSYITYNINPNVAKLLHLRLIRWRQGKDVKPMYPSSILTKYTKKWEIRYKKLLRASQADALSSNPNSAVINQNPWKNIGFQIMKEISKCYGKISKLKFQMCPTRFRCMKNLTSITMSEWIYGDNNWVTL